MIKDATSKKPKFRVLFIHHGNVLGGAPISLLHLIKGLQNVADLDIQLFCISDLMKEFYTQQLGIQVELFPNPLKNLGKFLIWGASPLELRAIKMAFQDLLRLPVSIYKQWIIFRRQKPDIIHLSSSVLFSSAMAAYLAGVPVVWHIREMVAGGPFSFRKRLAGWLIRTLATRVIACSPSEAECLGVDKKGNIRIIYHPVDFERFDPDKISKAGARQRLGIDPNAKIIVSLGGVSHWKGTVPILDAMSYTDTNTQLLFAGPALKISDEMITRRVRFDLFLEDLFVSLGMQSHYIVHYSERVQLAWKNAPQNRVRFMGFMDEVIDLIAASDAVVFAGMAPHYPRAIYEAWALKKPVIVFDVDGIRQKIANGVDGVVVHEKKGEALGRAICALLDNPGLIESMGENGRVKARNLCDRERNAMQALAVYKEILDLQY